MPQSSLPLSAAIVANAIMKVDGPYDVMLLRDSISLFTLNERHTLERQKNVQKVTFAGRVGSPNDEEIPVLRKCD